jgi:hypothetical protein
MKKILKPVIFLLPLFFLVVSVTAGNYPVTVKGYVFGFDRSFKFPLTGAKVELMDSDADGSQLFDDLMGTAVVNPDGSFSVSGTGGDPGNFSWSRPDVYVRFVYNYKDKVRLTDELNRTRYVNTPEHDHDNFEGTLDIGSWDIGRDVISEDGSKCGVWYQVCKAWDNYVSITGEEPKPGYCDVEYWSAIYAGTPWTNENTIHWPIHYSSSAAPHEFGHIIRHSFDGDRDHFNWDVTRFRYARNHSQCAEDCNNWASESVEMNRAFAFNEGWAEFWANEFFCRSGYSPECEGGVAFILKGIEDSLRNIYPQPRKFMCEVLKNNPRSIHSILEYIDKMRPPGIKSAKIPGGIIITKKPSVPDVVAEKKISSSPVPLEKTMVIINQGSQEISNRIILLNKLIQRKSSAGRFERPLRGEAINNYADRIINVESIENKKNILLVQQKMLQKSIQNNNYTEIPKKIFDKTFDRFTKEMKEAENKQIDNINLNAFQKVIASLKTIKEPNHYTTELLADLQKKLALYNELMKTGNKTGVRGYSQYDAEKIMISTPVN